MFRTRGKLLLVPGWRGVYDEVSAADAGKASSKEGDEDEGADQQLPRLEQGEQVQTREVASARKETKPPRRYSDASLLGAMETAGKLVDDDELREAMKDSGIGTPATRAAIIERLITVGYIERDGRSLVATEKGVNVIRLLNEHALTSPGLTGDWENRLGKIERGEDSREKFMGDIAGFAKETISELDEKLKDVRIPRASLGPCPVCGHEIMENRKGYSCWARDDPGCGFVIWKGKAGKQLPVEVARELIKTGYTARAITGSKDAADAASEPIWRSSRPRRANGGSSSTSRGPRKAPNRRMPRLSPPIPPIPSRRRAQSRRALPPSGPAPLRDPRLLADLSARPWSASSLELWIACPAKWFMRGCCARRARSPIPSRSRAAGWRTQRCATRWMGCASGPARRG